MKFAGQGVLKVLVLAMAGVWAGGALAADVKAAAVAPAKAQYWSASTGTVGVRWNRDLAADIGLTLGAPLARQGAIGPDDHEFFDLSSQGSLDFNVASGNLRDFVGGSLQALGGYVIESRVAGRIDLSNFRIVPRVGAASPTLDVVGADGQTWFYLDRVMYQLIDNNQRLALRTMDLRITPEMAKRIGHPEVADWAIADVLVTANVLRQGAMPEPRLSTRWHGLPVPGVPGATYEADLFMTTFNMQYTRCNGCTGAGGNGITVFTPSSTLRNNVNNGTISAVVPGDPLGTSTARYAADIPWHTKFTGNFPPYNNDQHPYLIWNLYRFNADGSIDQIGRSGVKHAFLTINTSCIINPGNSHVLGLGCADVYSVGNNDSNNSLGPRSEIIPATNVWGRCGSIYDTNCDGLANATPNGSFDQRLTVRESQFSGPAQTGATYRFESWYLARQDINVLNSMASVRATFSRPSTVWVVGGNDQYRLGPVIDRWVDPAAPGPNAATTMVTTAEGNTKVAMRATNLGNGLWRYDYAAMNIDFSRPITEGAEPNLRVVRALGFDNFTVPVGAATVSNLVFSDGDLDSANDWMPAIRDGRLTWTAMNRGNALNWGTMFRFSFTSTQAPTAAAVTMHVAADNTREVLRFDNLLAPAPLARGAATTARAAR
ncbi:MAG: hypothetical protein MUF76_06730 [Hydrogenophaga sp.]|jgi:hypothetical protein|nr:hypothetical protein [Hydrogenophaga sp.]